MKAGPFSIGSTCWNGLSKFVEETGEALQLLGKLIATGGNPKHWDGSDLRARLEEETADVIAAATYFARKNLDGERVGARVAEKLAQFQAWDEEQR